jgi:hypothetical protein
MDHENTEKKTDYSLNWMVFWSLAILTAGEFYLGVSSDGRAGIFMWFFALIKAGFIIANYMNIGRLFRRGQEH